MQRRLFAAILWTLLSAAIAPAHAGALTPPAPATLRAAADNTVLIGCSIGTRDVDDPKVSAVVAREFNCLTADNQMMPAHVVDEAGHYTFAAGDKIQRFAADHGMTFFGHMLVWQHETRDWFFSDQNNRPLPREQALQNLRAYISTVAGHYRGKVKARNSISMCSPARPAAPISCRLKPAQTPTRTASRRRYKPSSQRATANCSTPSSSQG